MLWAGVCPIHSKGTLTLNAQHKFVFFCACRYLPPNLHSVKVSKRGVCDECGARLLELDWRKGHSPLQGEQTAYTGCIACDDFLRSLSEVKHGRAFVKRGGGGRGRGGRGRRGR